MDRAWQATVHGVTRVGHDGGAWGAAVYGVTQSQTRLKRLSSSSSRLYWGTVPQPKHHALL